MWCACKWIYDVFGAASFSLDVRVSWQQQRNQICQTAFAFFESWTSFFNMFVDKLDVCEFEKKLKEFLMWMWMVNSTQWIHPTGWQVCVAPLSLLQTEQPKEDDIARCKCMRQLSLPVFLCGKGSKGGAVTAVCFWVLHLFKHSTWWRPTQLGTTCVRDLVVVIRFLLFFAW